MNLKGFCMENSLGNVKDVKKLTGGLMHKMFKVETDKGIYAIKVLNPEVMKRKDAMDNFIVSEKISNYAKDNGLPVSNALNINNNFINKFENDYYMVFDFIDGKTLSDDEITIEHCKKIGDILGRLHSLDYTKLGLDTTIKEDNFYVDWESYTKNDNFNKMIYKDEYLKNYKKYASILERVVTRKNASSKTIALCHKDMDPKNVMWKNDDPIIIDFESAKLYNPISELIEVALDWSGFLSNKFDEEKFKAVIESYIKHKKIEHNRYSSICGNLINRFGWLDYNLKRSLGIILCDEEDKKLAEEEVLKTIDEIKRFINLVGVMYKIICKLTKPEIEKNNKFIETLIKNNSLLKDRKYKLISRGFTNTIYQVDNYIIRICTSINNEQRFKNEIEFYKKNSNNPGIPKMYYYDTTKSVIPYYYEIIQKVDGVSLYDVWPFKTEEEKEEIIKKIINILKPFHDLKVDYSDFKEFIKNKIRNLEVQNININELLDLCDFYLKDNDLCMIHGDLHFDNVIINDKNELVLLDFERAMVGAIDYDFGILAMCRKKPYKWASDETDMLQTDYDYRNVIKMVLKNYPRLNNVKYLEERFMIYELIEDLKEYKAYRSKRLETEINEKIKKLRR